MNKWTQEDWEGLKAFMLMWAIIAIVWLSGCALFGLIVWLWKRFHK